MARIQNKLTSREIRPHTVAPEVMQSEAGGTKRVCADLRNNRQPYESCLNVRVGGGKRYCRCTIFFFFFLTRAGSLRIESHLQGERARPQSGAVSFTRGPRRGELTHGRLAMAANLRRLISMRNPLILSRLVIPSEFLQATAPFQPPTTSKKVKYRGGKYGDC